MNESAASFVQDVPVAADHPAFDGHFPGQPMLPGVVLLAEVYEALRAWRAQAPALTAHLGAHPGVGQAKFLSPVRPGESLRVLLQAGERGLRFEVDCGGRTVARGQLEAAA